MELLGIDIIITQVEHIHHFDSACSPLNHYNESDDDDDHGDDDDGDGQQPGREASRRQKPGVRQKPKFDFIFQNNEIRFLFEILSPIGVKVKNFHQQINFDIIVGSCK